MHRWSAIGWVFCLALVAGPAFAQTLTRAPKLAQFVEAEPPAGGGEATVVLVIEIGTDGVVTAVEIGRSGGAEFDAAAIEAARQFVFQPAEVDGEPAAVRIQYQYSFTETVEAPPPPTDVRIGGLIRLREGAPASGVRVAIDALAVESVTDDAGRFAFEALPPGLHTLSVSGEGLIAMRVTEDARTPGAALDVEYRVDPMAEGVDEEWVIRAPRRIQAQTRVTIRADEARRIPGTQGDTLKVVQSMPGVVRASGGSGALVVWGAAPEDTRVIVDGVEIPALYHIGGVRSTINSALVESIELVPGAFGPAYGRGLGGIVKVETRPVRADAVAGYVAAHLFDASAMLSAPLTPEFRAAVAGRVGYLHAIFPRFAEPGADALFPVPRYRDVQLKVEGDLGSDETIGLTAMWSDDAFERRSGDQSEKRTASHLAILAPYRRIMPDGASFTVVPHVVLDTRSRIEAFGRTPAEQQVESARVGLRADYRAAVSDTVTAAFGVDGLARSADVRQIGSLNRPAREGDPTVFGQPAGDDVTADALNVLIADVAVHGRAEITWGDVTIVPGLRLDAFALQGDRLAPPIGEAPRLGFFRLEPAIAPRLSARWAASSSLTVHAATGAYHQPPRPEELSPVFGNPTMGLSEATHVVAGLDWRPLDGVQLEVTGFYEAFDALVARDPSPTPPLAGALTTDGTGRSMGAQFLLRRTADGLSGWISYTLSRAERLDAPASATRLFDYDQTHVLSAVASAALGPLDLGAKVRYATGFPRTPVVGAYYESRGDSFQPLFGARNSIRIPSTFQIDLRAEYAMKLSAGELSVYLDVQNVTNRENAEEIVYDYDFDERGYLPGLPTLAILGARFEF